MRFFPFLRILSTAPLKVLPSLSFHCMPLKLLLHISRRALSSNSFTPFSSLSSGGSFPLSLKLSKWILRILSMPEGREGKGPDGRFMPLLSWSQKQRGQSLKRLRGEGDNVCGICTGKGRKFLKF